MKKKKLRKNLREDDALVITKANKKNVRLLSLKYKKKYCNSLRKKYLLLINVTK